MTCENFLLPSYDANRNIYVHKDTEHTKFKAQSPMSEIPLGGGAAGGAQAMSGGVKFRLHSELTTRDAEVTSSIFFMNGRSFSVLTFETRAILITRIYASERKARLFN